MKVILNQTVPKVGKQDTVVNVADGYARNYLFPRGLAIIADKKQVAALEKKVARIDAKLAGQKSDAEALGARLNGQTVRIPGQVGAAQGKLFGAITSADVAKAVAEQLGATLDRKQIALIDPIKSLGTHDVELDLYRSVDSKIKVVVYDPKAPVEAEPEADEEEAE